MNWVYQGKELTEVPKGYFGFIYMLTYADGKKYIGKKAFYDNKTLPALKNGEVRENAKRIKKRQNGKLVPYDIISKESNWKTYEGSLKTPYKEKVIEKLILMLCETKRYLTFKEAHALFTYEVLEDDNFLNENILGKFYKGNIK